MTNHNHQRDQHENQSNHKKRKKKKKIIKKAENFMGQKNLGISRDQSNWVTKPINLIFYL